MDQLVNERQNTANLLAAALTNTNEESDPLFNRGQSLQNTDALQSLLATAAEGDELLEYEDIVEEPIVPLRQQPQQPQQAPPAPRGRTRRPPGVPRRAQGAKSNNAEKGLRRPENAQRETVGTVERYSHTNEDGSFTFGYIAEDGSFREETRGVDCITRGKYGYIDPDGKKREFTYVSGLPCDITDEENASLDEEELQRDDPIAPNDRFRTSDPVQLEDSQIPQSARPRQRIPANRAPQDSALDVRANNDFTAFQQQPQRAQPPTRVRDPALRNRARPAAGQASTGALGNLLNIANGNEPSAPAASPVTRPRPQPATPRPSPQSRPSSFNFDSALDSFTLSKPALTFDDTKEQERAQEGAPKATGPNFSTELVFDPASGTFKTELRQALPNGEEVRVSDNAAPSGAARPTQQPTPAPTPSALPPTSRPFTSFSPTTLRPTPRPTQPAASPSSAFEPLTFPTPVPTRPARPATPIPSAAPTTPRPATPVPTAAAPVPASPSPSGSFFFQPFPTVGSPRPITPGSPQPTAQQPQNPTRVPAGTFLTFGGQPQPTQARPAGQPGLIQQPGARPVPFTVFNTQPRPTPSQARPFTPSIQPRPVTPIPASPTPLTASLSPSSPRPVTPTPGSPVTPQVQFGFQPIQTVQVQPQRPAAPQPPRPVAPQQARPPPPRAPPRPQAGSPFTAFATGTPLQLNGAPQSAFQSRPQTTFFGQPQAPRPQQLGIPPQLQQQQQQQPAGRFQPFGRPPPGPPQQRPQQRPSSPFTVFNPAALRGARFF